MNHIPVLQSATDNVITALEQNNRAREVFLWYLADWQLEEVLAAMQVPFPELTELRLISYNETLLVIPDSFLDEFAPRLRTFHLTGVPFPGFPKLLISVTHLVHRVLTDIPHFGYISLEAMAALLFALSSLKGLTLEFRSDKSRPDRGSRRQPPSKHSVIPALDCLGFEWVIEYLEGLVAFIDAPNSSS